MAKLKSNGARTAAAREIWKTRKGAKKRLPGIKVGGTFSMRRKAELIKKRHGV